MNIKSPHFQIISEFKQKHSQSLIPDESVLNTMSNILNTRSVRIDFISDDGVKWIFFALELIANNPNPTPTLLSAASKLVQTARVIMNENSGLEKTIQIPNAVYTLFRILY